MPDPIPVNRNVLQGQQQTQRPVPPVRPAAAARPIANPVTPPPPVRPRVTRQIPTPLTPLPITQPQPIPRNQNIGRGIHTQPIQPPQHTLPPRVAARPTNVTARRNDSGFGRGLRRLLVFSGVLMVAIWGATFAFPSLLQYGIIAGIAQFVSNVFYAIGTLAMWVYTRRDAILGFVIANPLLSMCVSIIVLLCIVLLWKSVHSRR